jgi:ribose transport system substrate-binding protein
VAVSTAVLALTVTACGSSKSSSSSSGGGATASSSSSSGSSSSGSGKLAAFQAKVNSDLAKAAAPFPNTVPTTGPKAVAGKTVYDVSCTLAAEGCAREAREAIVAGQAIGWHMKLLDTGSVPATMAQDVQQAINNHAAGMAVQAIDSSLMSGPLKAAKAAGLKIVCFACTNSANVYDHLIPGEQAFYNAGYTIGEEMYKATNGHPHVIFMYDPSFGVTGWRKQGTEQFFKDCQAAGGDCKIDDTANFLVTELTTRVPGLASQEIRSHPDANAMWMSYDSAQPSIAQGLRSAGVSPSKVGLYGFDGNTNNIAAIRSGQYEVATMAGSFEWVGWDEIDSLNRLFAGQQPVNNVIGFRLITKANVPSSNVVPVPFDYQAAYKKIWGK